MPDELPEIVEDAAAWGAWLGEHHAESHGVWLVLAKRGTQGHLRERRPEIGARIEP